MRTHAKTAALQPHGVLAVPVAHRPVVEESVELVPLPDLPRIDHSSAGRGGCAPALLPRQPATRPDGAAA